MITIHFDVTENEFDAICEYANMCGEFVSTIIRKIVMQEITFTKSQSAKDPSTYDYNMQIPEVISDQEEAKIIESNYNKIRTILGWDEIRIS